MTGRVVVFGATGYTGRLVVEALATRGVRPVVAGRRADSLRSLAQAHGDLDIAVADVDHPDTVRGLVERGDVLVSTVGPFDRYGAVAVRAAVGAGAHYVDSTGEASFIRHVFDVHSGEARRSGSALLTAFGYDYVPGNLAGALALRAAGPAARRVHVGYFWTGARAMSTGTRATVLSGFSAPHHVFRDGRVVEEPAARRVRHFDVDGRRLPAGSVGGTEAYTLPRLEPALDEVVTFLGWLGPATRVVQAASYVLPVLSGMPGLRQALSAPAGRALRRTGGGPDAATRARGRSRIVAVALDGAGAQLAAARVEGVDGYTLTGRLIAWAAERLAAGGADRAGALGPVDAFGLPALEAGCREAGLTTIDVAGGAGPGE